MTHSQSPMRPHLRRGIALSVLVLAACRAEPAATPPGVTPPGSEPVRQAPATTRATPGGQLPAADGPGLIRPPWDGRRKTPVAVSPLAYPTTWQGQVTVTDLAMIGATLYTVDRSLQAVPLAGGTWQAVPGLSGAALTRLASDGARLFAGTAEGKVVGLDPGNGRSATLATVPSGVTALEVGQGALWAATERDGVYRVPLDGGSPRALGAGSGGDRRITDLALGQGVVFSLGDRLVAWPMDGTTAREVPNSAGVTALTAHRGVLYAGTADGWLLASRDQGQSVHALGQMVETPLEAVGTDGAWLYSSSGNTTYMLDLKRYEHSLCHAGLPAAVTSLTVLDGATVLVGTRGRGLTSMPR